MQPEPEKKSLTCSACGAKYKIAASHKGSSIACRRCGQQMSLAAPPAQHPAGIRRTTGGRRAISMRRARSGITPGQIACAVGVLALLLVAVIFAL